MIARWFQVQTIVPLLLALIGFVLAPSAAFSQNTPPVVGNVQAQQSPGTGYVTVTYDLSDAEGDNCLVTVVFSSDGGQTFDLRATSVSGSVNKLVQPGPMRSIIWDAAADYPGVYFQQVVARIVATDGTALVGEMVLVPAGNYLRGNDTDSAPDNPEQTLFISEFLIDKYEVTNAAYQQFMDNGGYDIQAYWSPEGWAWKQLNDVSEPVDWSSGAAGYGVGYPGFPVRGVSYYEAEAYANFVGKRLPTEAEWEKAARGTDGRAYPWGNTIGSENANYRESNDPFEGTTHTTPVGFYDGRLYPDPPFQTVDSLGPYGTYDQTGNVREWVRDFYDINYYAIAPTTDPLGPIAGSVRAVRGGDCTDSYSIVTTYRRRAEEPGHQPYYMGFRCARTP